MRRIILVLIGGALAAIAVLSMRDVGHGFHVSGDGAPSLAALSSAQPDTAKIELILLRRWQNLESLPDLQRLCRAACNGDHWAVMVNQPGPYGLRRVLLVDVSKLGAGPSLDTDGTLPDAAVTCLTDGLTAFLAFPRGLALCDQQIHHTWRLPYGL